MNPLLIVPSIARVPKDYAIACGISFGILVLQAAAQQSVRIMNVPIASYFVSGLVSFYFVIVEMRMLGMLYRTHKDDLGWFTVRGR